MTYIEIVLLVMGVIALVVGYRKHHRNLLLSAAIILFLAGATGDLARGFHDGFNAGWHSAAVSR
jgi:hypothetical protein